jgi:hypothetical protein
MSESVESEPKSVKGFIVMSENRYLGEMGMVAWEKDLAEMSPEEYARSLVWTEHDKPEEARVIDAETVYLIPQLIEEGKWKKMPTHIIPAQWNEQSGVVLLGEKIDFDKLPPREDTPKNVTD